MLMSLHLLKLGFWSTYAWINNCDCFPKFTIQQQLKHSMALEHIHIVTLGIQSFHSSEALCCLWSDVLGTISWWVEGRRVTSVGRDSLTGGPSEDSACWLGLRGQMDILGSEGTSVSPCEEAFSGTLWAAGRALGGLARTARLWTWQKTGPMVKFQ